MATKTFKYSGSKTRAPLVSIIIGVHNDEDFVGRAIESALDQTEHNVEVICIDDASTDRTADQVKRYLGDSRLRIISSEVNRSAYQVRRLGVEAATAPFTLFLDGDDELVANAAELSLTKARNTDADVVGFGVEIVMPNGQGAPKFERSLQPKHKELEGHAIVSTLFPIGQPAQGHLWKYLFKTELLRQAYSGVGETEQYYRANDIPISFLALAYAEKYVSVNSRLYRYYFRRGTSGQAIHTLDDYNFYLSAIDSIESIQDRVPDHAIEPYVSARRSMIGNLVRDCLERTVGALRAECLEQLTSRVGALDVVLAAADYCRPALPMLIDQYAKLCIPRVEVARSVVVTTAHLQTGGLRGVLAAQVHRMTEENIDVTVALHRREPTDRSILPEAKFALVHGSSWGDKILNFIEICIASNADAVIDHHLLYDEYWPFYALAARAVGIQTIGWVHSFSLRPVFNGSTRLSFMMANMAALETVVVLSPTDAAFWSLNGVENAVYLPNPPSPMLVGTETGFVPKTLSEGPINLVWWGRLEQSTKQVRELLKVAKELQTLGTDFKLSIIGPDGADLTQVALVREAEKLGIEDKVDVVGPLYDSDLVAALQDADVFLMTSAIEGYPLTLVEGQANGLPIVMYEMPWLAYPENNHGIVTVAQNDSRQMAIEVTNFVDNPELYRKASLAAVSCAKPVFDLDYGILYRKLIEGRLDPSLTSAPTAEEYAVLMRLSVAYSERTARALGRARKEISSLRTTKPAHSSLPSSTTLVPVNPVVSLPDIEPFEKYRKRPGSVLRTWLSKLLPSSWRQANFIAERQVKWSRSALTSLAEQQQDLTQAVNRLQDTVKRLQK